MTKLTIEIILSPLSPQKLQISTTKLDTHKQTYQQNYTITIKRYNPQPNITIPIVDIDFSFTPLSIPTSLSPHAKKIHLYILIIKLKQQFYQPLTKAKRTIKYNDNYEIK